MSVTFFVVVREVLQDGAQSGDSPRALVVVEEDGNDNQAVRMGRHLIRWDLSVGVDQMQFQRVLVAVDGVLGRPVEVELGEPVRSW